MKIAHIINNLTAGGAQTFLVSLAIEQQKLGHDVVIIIVDKITDPNFENYLLEKLKLKNITVHFLDRRLGKNLSIMKSLSNLNKIFKKFSPDIVNSHIELSHLIVGFYCKVFKPFSHKTWQHIITLQNAPENWAKNTLYFNRTTPSIYCSNASIKTSIERHCKKTVIDNGIETPVLKSGLPDMFAIKNIDTTHKHILCVGKLSKQKNYPLVVEIAKEYLGENVSFIICGTSGDSTREDLSSFEGTKNIFYLGVCTPDEIHYLMDKCDCFLNTSIFEGLPITVLEAFFLGVPCVLSPILPHEDMGLTMPYCYLATSFNYKSFVEKINKVLSLDITKNDIRIERANYLKKFDIRFTAPKYIEFYEALLNKQLISK